MRLQFVKLWVLGPPLPALAQRQWMAQQHRLRRVNPDDHAAGPLRRYIPATHERRNVVSAALKDELLQSRRRRLQIGRWGGLASAENVGKMCGDARSPFQFAKEN